MARLIIVRHGNTFDKGDTITRVGGRTDLPLSVSGRAQASALGRHFSGTRFSAAFCSPLKRTRATARAIIGTGRHAPALLILPFLKEIDYGPDENQPEEAVIGRLGEAAIAAWDRDATPPPGWIVDPAALRRGWTALLERAGDLDPDETVLVVTSNGIARFLPDVVDEKPDGLTIKLKTGAWGTVIARDGKTVLTEWNRRP